MAATFDPYYKWLGIPPAEQPPNYYRLLAINPFETDPDVIEAAADQRMVHLRSLQTGQHAELTQKLLNQISTAKVCLLRPDKKKEYDDRLRAKLAKAAPPQAPPAAPPGDLPSAASSAEARMAVQEPVAAGPLDFIDNPAPAPKTGVWEPEPLPLSPRGSFKSSASGYSSRKTKKSSQTPIFGIVAAVVVVGIAIGAYIVVTSQSAGDTNQANPSNSGTNVEKHPGDELLTGKPKTPPHPALPKIQPANTPSNPHPPSTPDVAPTEVAIHPPVATNPDPDKPDKPRPHKQPPESPKLPEAAAETRKPIPDQAAQAKALAQVRDVLKDDYAKALTADARLDLVRSLIKLASETKDNADQRYVMGTQAMDLAVKAGDADLAFEAIDGLDSYFAVDGWDMKAQAMIKLSHLAKSTPEKQYVATHALSMTDNALAADHYDAAVEIANVAAMMADAVGEPLLRDQAHEARSRAQRMQNVAEDFKAAKQKLAAHPDDADANLIVGRFLCFQKGDWKAGLPFLSHGSDVALKKLAGMEAAAPDAPPDSPTGAADRAKLGDAWWNAAEKIGDNKSPFVIAMFARAKYWYHEALPGLSGLDLKKAEKRSSEDAGVELGAVKMVYLDDLPEQDVSVGLGSLGKQGASGLPEGSPQTVSFRGVTVKHALAMAPPENGKATVSFTVDRKFHNFTAVVGLQDKAKPKSAITFEARGDGKILWISRPIRGAEESQECNVPVGNFRVLQLEVHSAGDNGDAWAVWVNPILKR
ncbi:MAG TPA: NPCBM/NEW2 domain-containing protein [Pirellulales bacterium]|nr:NPCBM/NEW2 domain-containing protein [Pirellulales bacterium]